MADGDLKSRTVAQNRKARHNYIIEDTLEAGLALVGTEVKSLRDGKASLGDAFAQVNDGEMFLVNAHIAPYGPANRFNHEPLRPRKLLLHRREIARLAGLVQRQGYSIVPLKLYFNGRGRAKVELGIGRGRKLHDKRDRTKERDWQREQGRLLRDKG